MIALTQFLLYPLNLCLGILQGFCDIFQFVCQGILFFPAKHTDAFWGFMEIWFLLPKCGCSGTGSDEVELCRIWVITSSSCWAEIAISLSFFEIFSLPSGFLHDFLAFLALPRRVKALKLHALLMLFISLTNRKKLSCPISAHYHYL